MPSSRMRAPIVSVPRRFGAGEMMVFVTLFALLFGLFRYSNAPAALYPLACLFCAAVAVGQIILFRGGRPRAASCVAGSAAMPLLWITLLAVTVGPELIERFRAGWVDRTELTAMTAGFLCSVVFSAALGWLAGYLIGTLSAGVFLVMDRKWNAGRFVEEAPIVAEVVDEETAWEGGDQR